MEHWNYVGENLNFGIDWRKITLFLVVPSKFKLSEKMFLRNKDFLKVVSVKDAGFGVYRLLIKIVSRENSKFIRISYETKQFLRELVPAF